MLDVRAAVLDDVETPDENPMGSVRHWIDQTRPRSGSAVTHGHSGTTDGTPAGHPGGHPAGRTGTAERDRAPPVVGACVLRRRVTAWTCGRCPAHPPALPADFTISTLPDRHTASSEARHRG
ncbi:hypothetical protein QJS66_08515 [Kocuria rhizophila]|nr:hypothetical protein QJS66_08515 [Kocuria rhizophila]